MHKLGNKTQIKSKSVNEHGYLHDVHGAHGKTSFRFPDHSFELKWDKMPNAKSYALLLEDFDAMKVIGFPFIHWVAVNVKENFVSEAASKLAFDHLKENLGKAMSSNLLWQGYNSSVSKTLVTENKEKGSSLNGILPEMFTSLELEDAAQYFGPYPPDKDHVYTLTVFGLDVDASELEYKDADGLSHKLDKPYYVGDFLQAVDTHVVGTYTLNFKYRQAGSN